jgi:uncharacterized protein
MKKSITAIVKPTSECNLACKYCYVENSSEKGRMSDETLELLLENLGEVNKGKRSEIIWHGGEPLVMGLDFYQKAKYFQFFIENENQVRFRNGFQTNGTLVDEEVIKFCKDYNFSLGFSLDGTKHLNDKTRVYHNGEGAFNEIFKGFNLAREYKLSNGFILILTKENIDKVDEIYNFIKENKFSVKINPLIYSGQAKINNHLSIKPKEYAQAIIKLFDLYFYDNDFKGSIDPLDTFMGNVTFNQAYGCCSFNRNCQDTFISINHIGDVYPCGRFDGIDEFKMGNIHDEPLSKILKSEVRDKLMQRIPENIESCVDCEYIQICNSGCMNNGYMVRGNFMDKDYYCSGYKEIFSHMKTVIRKELEKALIER